DVDQLRDYKRLTRKFPGASKVLLCFGDNPFQERPGDGWQHFSYETLAAELTTVLPQIPRSFDAEFLREYVSLVRDISRVLSFARISADSDDYFMLDVYHKLAEYRLHDLVYKFRADQMATRIRSRVQCLLRARSMPDEVRVT